LEKERKIQGMASNKSSAASEREDRYSALYNNANAIRAIASAIEGTLGPKGLDTMLVDGHGEVVITNDGVTILDKMEVNHPAARLLIQVAKVQQAEIGDGTTTATILASSLIQEGVAQVSQGVPVAKVIYGLRQGVEIALDSLQKRTKMIESDDDPFLKRIAYIAGRENQDIAELILDAVKQVGLSNLRDSRFRFADTIHAHDKAENEVIQGMLVHKLAMNRHMPEVVNDVRILVIDDAFEPEIIDEEALATNAGFERYMLYLGQFEQNLLKLKELGVNMIAADRGVHPSAEEFCIDHGILVIQRISSKDLRRLCECSGARPLKRTGIKKPIDELTSYLGRCHQAVQDDRLEKTRILTGKGSSVATLLVGASTREVVGERERIAKDAASSVQAAVRGGYLPGGGSVEIAVSREIEKARERIRGMEGFGMEAVARSLRRPLAQIVSNAGFNALEKVEQVRGAQVLQECDSLGIDCDTGQVLDMVEAGIVDPTPVKLHALKTASEVAAAILRIHTVIRMKEELNDDLE
jgi:chaperonin GroEL (HSP60 family)